MFLKIENVTLHKVITHGTVQFDLPFGPDAAIGPNFEKPCLKP